MMRRTDPSHPLEEASEADFERIARLARRVLDVDAVFLFVHQQARWRQRFASATLFESAQLRQRFVESLPKDVLWEVGDARAHPDFEDLDLAVNAPKLRFLASVPLSAEEQTSPIALLVVSDPRCRNTSLSREDHQSLEDIAASISAHIKVRLDRSQAIESTHRLEQLSADLKRRERELDDKSQQLEHLVEELRRSNHQLEKFAYVASHDLQEPLRMVTSFLSLLAEEYEGELGEDADEYIGYAVDGARRMKEMINALLVYSRVRTSSEEFVRVNLEPLIERVRAMTVAAHAEVDVEITSDALPEVYGRPGLLERLFANLFSNAVKYANAHRRRIHVSCEQRADEFLFMVEDNGIGIPPDQHERIFDIFVRGSASSGTKGTGIGLAICSTIVEEHGGRIWVDSQPGHGSTFSFTLPKPTQGGVS